jgi:hypothetical protein
MQLPERYERMQKKHVIVKAHNVGLSIDKLQVCLSSPEHFLMSVRKDMVRLHFDELPSTSLMCRDYTVFRADQTCKKVIDFKQLDEVQVAALTDYHVVVFDQYTEQQLCIFNALPEKQTTLVMHPNFDLASLPVVVASSNQGLSIEDVAKSGLHGVVSLDN